MALSKSEIEILIKARNEAQGAFDSLSKQVTAVTGGAGQATAGLDKVGKAAKNAGAAGQGASVMFGMLAERLARGLVGAIGDTISAANKLDSGLIGLASVAKAFGNDADAAKEAAVRLAADGLMGVGDAATSLKNLLAAGFGLDQAIVLMNRFKDSAAFGRQGSLEFGEAIRGATEGIKNGNSILVDNAGVTKNLSQMLTEAGFSAQDLSKASSDVNVRMAIYNGILKETNPQLGDTARYLDTAAGKQAAFSAQVTIAQQQIGKALQPALTSLLAALTPLVQTLGTMAPVLVPLGAAIGAVVIPLAAMRAAAALGIPSMTALGTSITGAIAAAGNQAAFGRTATAITGVGEAAKTASVGVGMLQRAVLVFAAFEVGQGIGKLVTQVQELGKESDSTGGKIAAAFMKYTGIGAVADSIQGITEAVVTAADGTASLSEQMDVIQKASEQAGRQIISYSEAMSILAAKTPPAEVAMRNFWATLTKAPNLTPTLAQGEALMAQFDKIGGAAKASADRVDGWNSELNRVANAGGLATLRKELDAGILTTKELSVQFGIGEDAIKFYEKKLKDAGEAAKAHTKTQEEAKKKADDLRKANEDLADSLFDLGVVTTATGQKALKDLIAPLSQAGSTSTPAFQQALIKLLPELEGLAKKAAASGIQVTGLAAALDRSKKAAEDQVAPMIAWENSLPTVAIEDLITGTQTWTAEQEWAGVQATKTADAFKFFGISTRDELAKTAAEAERSYGLIVASVGAAAPEAKRAYQAMIDAQKAASRELPNVWQSEIFPKMKDVLVHLGDATNGAFAQMLLGAKGFKDGFVDIWHSIKSAVGNILNSILSVFLNTFLKGIMGAMSGQKGAFGASFSSMFSGGTGGGFSLGSLFGGAGGAGGGLPGASGSVIGGPEFETGEMLKPGGGGGASGAQMAGGAMMAAGGVLSFIQARKSQSKLGQTVGGAMTGAGIGTMIMPGIGTAIGAGVGALGGLIASFIGGSKEKKANQSADQELKGIQEELLKTYGSLEKIKALGPAGASLAAAWGSKGTAGLAVFQDAVKGLNTQLEKTKALESDLAAAQGRQAELMSWNSVNQTAQKYGLTLETLGPKMQQLATTDAATALINDFEQLKAAGADVGGVLVGMKDQISKIVQESIVYGTALPANMEPVIAELIRTGQLLDANGKAYTDISQVKFGDPVVSETEQIATSIGSLTEALKALITQMGGIAPAAGQAAGGVEGAFRGVHIKIPVDYDVADFPGLPSPEPPGAAGGIMTGQPNLVLFGEGGETELGGPKSFFRDVFASLGLEDRGRSQGSDQAPISIGPFNITAMSSSDLKGAIERDVIPPILDALRVNRRGSLTDMKSILGVA